MIKENRMKQFMFENSGCYFVTYAIYLEEAEIHVKSLCKDSEEWELYSVIPEGWEPEEMKQINQELN